MTADPYYYKSEPFDLSEYSIPEEIFSYIEVNESGNTYNFEVREIVIGTITSGGLTKLSGSGDFDEELTIEVKCIPYAFHEYAVTSAVLVYITPEYKGEPIVYSGIEPITGIDTLSAFDNDYTAENFSKLDLTGCGEVKFNQDSIYWSIAEEMRELYLPSKCTIEDNAFPGSSFIALEKVVFSPNTELTIGASAFNSCTNLKSINLENTNLTVINVRAFSDCTSLTQVTIPQSVTTIGAAAFYNCEKLTIVYILPRSTAWAVGAPSIDQYAFYGCGSAVGSGELDVFFMDEPNAFSGFESSTYPSYAKGHWSGSTYLWNPTTVQWEE